VTFVRAVEVGIQPQRWSEIAESMWDSIADVLGAILQSLC